MAKCVLCFRLFHQMVKQIASEAMLVLLAIAPILAGSLFKFGIPLLETKLLARLGYGEVLVPYYGYFNWLLALLSGMLFAFVGALVVLGEIDDGVAKYICVTPAGAGGYLVARIFLPAIVSGIIASIIIPVFSLIHIDLKNLLIMIVSTVLSGIITSLLVIAISSNKVEGMAIGKLSGGFGMILFVPLIIKGPVQYVFSLFPMFWIGKYIQDETWIALPLSLILFVGWIYCLMKKFGKRI
ncbi:MAG: ABC transporter permease [Agathobacter sp.]